MLGAVEEHPNALVARRLWEAIAEADVTTLRAILAEKPAWRMTGRSALAGTYVGVEAILSFLARVGELSDELTSDLKGIYAGARGAVIHYRIHATRGDKRMDTEHLFLIQIEDGRITHGLFALFDPYRYDRFFPS